MTKTLLLRSSILKIKTTTLYRLEDTALTIINIENGTSYKLKGVSTYLWLHLDGSRSLGEIIEKLNRHIKNNSTDNHRAMKFFEDIFLKNLVSIEKKKSKKCKVPQLVDRTTIKNFSKKIEFVKNISTYGIEIVAGTSGSSASGTSASGTAGTTAAAGFSMGTFS